MSRITVVFISFITPFPSNITYTTEYHAKVNLNMNIMRYISNIEFTRKLSEGGEYLTILTRNPFHIKSTLLDLQCTS
jgi:hypothetical protein